MKPSVSFCLIACNEEPRLEACLGSVADLCDELLVVDTGSTDGTVDKARSLGARVEHFEWMDDFAAARNFGLSRLSGEWVLMLDADEHLLPEALPGIRRQLEPADNLVVNLLRREFGATQSPVSSVSRLFRRHPALRFERPYHAMIDDSVERLLLSEPDWRIVELQFPAIFHTGYQADEITGRDKAERARRAMEGYHAAHPEDPYVCSKLGALLFSLGDRQHALQLLQTGLHHSEDPSVSNHVRYELHFHLGLLHRRMGELDRARHHYGAALRQELPPMLDIGARFNLASLDHEQGRLEEALQTYRDIIDLVPDLPQAHLNLAMGLKARGQLIEAETHYRTAIELDPLYADAHRNLGVLLYGMGRATDALECFTRALECYDRQSPEEAASFRSKLLQSGILGK